MAREKDVEGPTKRWARGRGWYVRKFTSPARRSVPDDIFIRGEPGGAFRLVFIEFKATGATPTDAQWEEIKALRLQGVHADYADDVKIAKCILEGSVRMPGPEDRSHPRTRCTRPQAVGVVGEGPGDGVLGVAAGESGKKARKRRRPVPRPEGEWFSD